MNKNNIVIINILQVSEEKLNTNLPLFSFGNTAKYCNENVMSEFLKILRKLQNVN